MLSESPQNKEIMIVLTKLEGSI